MNIEKERLEDIIRELISELSEAADPDYLEETFSNIFTDTEKGYFGI